MDELKRSSVTPSGRTSILKGSKFARGFIVRPEQILRLIHDTQPAIPIPKDAEFQGLGLEDAGVDSKIQFYFVSKCAPTEHCFQMNPELFFRMLVDLACGLLPLDSVLDGVEISQKFTVILLRVKSSHWPGPRIQDDRMPLYHLRYEFGKLLLVDPSKAIENEKRLRVTNSWTQ
jgi:hypothetical protein